MTDDRLRERRRIMESKFVREDSKEGNESEKEEEKEKKRIFIKNNVK